jgi:hypothetical protein
MKRLRTIFIVGTLACAFILAIGIFTVGAVELCWSDPDEPDDIIRLEFLWTGNNYLVNGFVGPIVGDERMILTGSGRVVGTNLIIHLSGSGPRPDEPGYEIINATMVLDLITGNATVEAIALLADRTIPDPPNTRLEYLGSWPIFLRACP